MKKLKSQGLAYGREEIVLADLSLDDVAYSQLDFDVTGHDARPDIF